MTPERLREIEKLFHETRDRPPAERDAFLARACRHDSALRREVEDLTRQKDAVTTQLGQMLSGLSGLVPAVKAADTPAQRSGGAEKSEAGDKPVAAKTTS